MWQKSTELCLKIYTLTARFPKEELYGLTSQIRRAAVSVPSNIAEGRSRGTRKDFVQFLRVAMGSIAELETQCFISKELTYLSEPSYREIALLLDEISRMLMAMIKKLAAIS